MSNNVKTAPVAEKLTAKQFTLNVLNGMAIGIVAALIANAAIGGILKALSPHSSIFVALNQVATAIQFATAPLIGFIVGMNFKFTAFRSAMVALVAYVAAGNVVLLPTETFTVLVNGEEVQKTIAAHYAVRGIGDVLNVLLACALAAGAIIFIKNRFGALELVLSPIVVAVGVGTISVWLGGYVGLVTKYFGEFINNVTSLQPLLMCPILAVAFSFAVSSPLSSVALALITGITGLASGAANIGVASAASFLIVAGWKANRIGVPVAIAFGAIKMMLPKLVLRPQIFLAIFVVAAINGLNAALFGIVGDTQSAGFGYISLIGPLKAYALMTSSFKLVIIIWSYLVLPFVSSYIVHTVCTRYLKMYDNEYFRFNAA